MRWLGQIRLQDVVGMFERMSDMWSEVPAVQYVWSNGKD
jgi:hypothetical protein